MKRSALLALMIMLVSPLTLADTMRPANGKPCYLTEKTYYDTDGVTPYACKPAGGPAYSFKVYTGATLLWEGKLPANEPEVHFDLPVGPSVTTKQLHPYLLVRRDLEADPQGYVVFFGEGHLAGFKTFDGEGAHITFPEMSEGGWRLLLNPEDGGIHDRHFGKLPDAVVDSNDYRLVIRLD